MRSKGIQPGEELLPEEAPGDAVEEEKVLPNEEIVIQLVSMGFKYLHCQKAAINTLNVGLEEAMNWLLSHMDDPDIDAPISQKAQNAEILMHPSLKRLKSAEVVSSPLDQSKVDTLVSFGFDKDIAKKALTATGGDIERATDWIFSNNVSGASYMDVSSSSNSVSVDDSALPDGGGKYRLMGIVSHIGTSTHCGHYVAHIYKEGRWVIFNDDKVGVSKSPPKDMGYLYVFERLSS